MASVLVKCGYGEEELGAECCLRGEGELAGYRRCPVFDWEECPFGKRVEGCGTCEHTEAMSIDWRGERIVDCGANGLQMYAPYATHCKRWERAIG